MRRLLVIPARLKSKRIKNKNIKNFFSKPIIYYSLNSAKRSKLFIKIHVSTESKLIASTVNKLGFDVDFLRPKKLSTDKIPLIDVMKFVFHKYRKMNINFDEIWCLLPCAPLINHDDLILISKTLKKLNKPVLTVSKFPAPVEWSFKIKNLRLKPVNKNKLLKNSQTFEKKYYDNGQLFAFPEKIFKNLNKNNFYDKFFAYILPREKSVDIDEIDDWKFAEVLFKNLNR